MTQRSDTLGNKLSLALAGPGPKMALGRLSIALMGILTTPVYTRLISPEEYGTLALGIAVVALAATAPTQWLTASLLRFAPLHARDALLRPTVVATAINIPVSMLAGFTLAWLIVKPDMSLSLAVAAAGVTEGIFATAWILTRAKLRTQAFIWSGITRNALPILLSLIFFFGLDRELTATAILWMNATGAVAGFILICALVYRGNHTLKRHQREIQLRSWVRYGYPLIFNYLLVFLTLQIDKLFIDLNLSRAEVGAYAATHGLLTAGIGVPASLIGLALVPRLFGAHSLDQRSVLTRQLGQANLVVIPSTCVAAALGWPLIERILIDDRLHLPTIWIPIALIIGFGLNAFRAQYFNILLQAHHKTANITLTTFLGALTTLAALIVLTPLLGLLGAALSTLLASLSMFMLSWQMCRSLVPAHEEVTH